MEYYDDSTRFSPSVGGCGVPSADTSSEDGRLSALDANDGSTRGSRSSACPCQEVALTCCP
eukprot:XP_001707378.1 Hypothetical protein GL50803_6204 [Giardia lamblia ATCC 50803]